MNRIQLVYIAGRYRHYLPDGRYDRLKMSQELADERHWIFVIARAGCGWIAPLHNTVMAEGLVPQDVFIEHDLEIIGQMDVERSAILLRPGWEATPELPESVGVLAEYDRAQMRGLLVIHGKLGEAAVTQWLLDPEGVLGE